MAFLGLVKVLEPNLVNLYEYRETSTSIRLETAFRLAKDHLGIPRLLEISGNTEWSRKGNFLNRSIDWSIDWLIELKCFRFGGWPPRWTEHHDLHFGVHSTVSANQGATPADGRGKWSHRKSGVWTTEGVVHGHDRVAAMLRDSGPADAGLLRGMKLSNPQIKCAEISKEIWIISMPIDTGIPKLSRKSAKSCGGVYAAEGNVRRRPVYRAGRGALYRDGWTVGAALGGEEPLAFHPVWVRRRSWKIFTWKSAKDCSFHPVRMRRSWKIFTWKSAEDCSFCSFVVISMAENA